MKYAEIAVGLPIDRLFHYSIPQPLAGEVAVGKRVKVPFQNKEMVGYIVGFSDTADVRETKDIIEAMESEPILNPEMLELTKWISQSYFCSWGEAIGASIPAGLKKRSLDKGPRRTRASGEIVVEEIPPSSPLMPTKEQKSALEVIISSIESGEFKVFLLHGITASGKTEVYLQAIHWVLKKGKGAIVLVPEISLTPQTAERFISRFGELVAVIHSKLTSARRLLEWKKLREGKARIVIGARSAVFSPLKDLGLIIVDEEHETSYKQEDVPRYHARDVAEMRARLCNCPLILGSATPSLESYRKAKRGEYKLVKLTKRIDERMMPKVKIVDMRLELATRRKTEIFSRMLIDAIDKTLKDGNKVMIFLNRRGFSTFVSCRKCGLTLKCKRCDSVLVYHYLDKKLLCHYCSYRLEPPEVCPKCRSSYIKYFGLGTEKVELEITRRFPYLSIARMDSDTTTKRGSHDRILGEFRRGDASIIVGTQMIAKGLDFPEVTLVGVVSADVTLNLPDFRASERTFNLLTQVAGRAGRGEKAGEVIVQTYAPDHYSILTAAKHDYEKFYEREVSSRKELLFPPFVHLAKITVRSRNDELARKVADDLAKEIGSEAARAIKIAGPAPSPIAKMRGYFRWNILLKGKDRKAICELLKKALAGFKRPSKVLIAIDVDPISM